MRRRPASNSSMSLFPFLDTLVCTMGALILMLLAMTPKMKERALARQAAAQAAAQAPLDAPAVEPEPDTAAVPEPHPLAAVPTAPPAEEHAAERQRRRDAWLSQAADARSTLAARMADFQARRQQLKDTEQRLRDLHDQILKTQLKTENAGQASAALDDQAQKLEAQAAVVAQKIAATRKNIDLASRRQAASKNEYSLVAYDGVSGTVRRPIYIECTGKGFRFLPENETVSPTDLEGFSDNFNPLLAGAQTLVRFWSRRKRNAGPAEPEPYVLLLVRPSGCFTYYVARKYLSSLGVHWGYELIEDDWKLSIPEPDPVAKTMLKETLDSTAQLRRVPKREVAAAGDRDFSGAFDPSELFDRDAGRGRSSGGTGGGGDGDSGFGRPGRAGGTGRGPSIKQGYATRNDRQGGDRFPGDGSFGASGTGEGIGGKPARTITTDGARPAGGASPGQDSVAATAAGIGGGGRSGRGAGSGGTARAADEIEASEQSPGRVALATDGTAGHGAGSPGGADGKQPGGSGRNPATGDSSGEGAESDGGAQAKTGGGKTAGGTGSSRRARPASLGGSSDTSGDGDGNAGDDAQSAAGFIGDDELLMNPRGPSGPAAGAGGAAGFQPRSPATANARQPGAPGSAGAESSATAAASTGNPAAGAEDATGQSKPSWLSDPSDASSSTSRSTGPRARMGGPGATVSLGSSQRKRSVDQDEADAGPRISEDQSNKPTSGPTVRSRGPRKWGQAGRRAGIGFEKRIKIYLNDKRIVVDSKDHMLLVSPADASEEIINHVVSSIDQVADSWGEPPSNFYWVPAVQFIVYPGGNANYAKLQSALEQKWGVSSTVEYAPDRKEKPAAAGGRP